MAKATQDSNDGRPLGKYASMRQRHLKEFKRGYYKKLVLEGKLADHLAKTEERANERLEELIEQLNRRDPPPDKEKDPMGWVGHMNMARMMAEEIVLKEYVYESYDD